MRTLQKILLSVLVLILLMIGVSAAPYTFTTMDGSCQVDNNGTCRFSVTGVVEFHETVTEFTIPLGQNVSQAEAEIYTTSVRKDNGNSVLVFSREAGFAGEMNVTWHYTVRNTVSTSADNQIFTMPMLAAQEGDVSNLTYTIHMPDVFSETPVFTSGYYADGIDNYMDVSISEGVITTKVNQTLMAGDALSMSLTTDPGYFSMRHAAGRTVLIDTVLLILSFILAVTFWFWKLRFPLPRLAIHSHLPTGANAGVLRYIATNDEPDLALLCANWASAGYLSLFQQADGAIFLQKRMPMGNEREIYEIKIFEALFQKGDIVSADSRRFLSIEQYAAKPVSHFWQQRLYKKNAPSPLPLRLIGLLGGLAASLCAADTAIDSFRLRLIPVILLTLLGGLLCWQVQQACICCLRRSAKRRIAVGIVSGVLLQIFAAIAGIGGIMLAALLLQMLVGSLLIFGVKRSRNGVMMLEQILALRRYLIKFKKTDVADLQGQASSYYYQMLPYAEALGIGAKFSKVFSDLTLEPCTWFQSEDSLNLRDTQQFYQTFHTCIRIMHRENQPNFVQQHFMSQHNKSPRNARRRPVRGKQRKPHTKTASGNHRNRQ